MSHVLGSLTRTLFDSLANPQASALHGGILTNELPNLLGLEGGLRRKNRPRLSENGSMRERGEPAAVQAGSRMKNVVPEPSSEAKPTVPPR